MSQNRRQIVDTNVIVRHLVHDDPRQAAATRQVFAACERGEITLVLLSAVLAECVFVLESFYRHARMSIADALMDFIESPGIEMADAEMHLDALRRYGKSKLHFVDCLIAAAAADAVAGIATFDKALKKLGKKAH